MIVCLPNGGFYELYGEHKQLELLKRLGVTVVVWNYRGYGLSGKSPTMQNIVEDGEKVVDYLREHYPGCKIGVTGESMGGHVACLLAQNKQLDLLCADRTFNRLT